MTMTEPFEAWEMRARIALGDQGMGYHAATPIIADVRAHCAYTGESPYAAFGEPAEFAATTAAEQPPELLTKVDRTGSTAMGHLSGQACVLSLVAVVLPLFFAVKERTWTFPATTAALTGSALLVLALFAAGAVPQALRAGGRPHLAKFGYVGAVVLGVGAVGAYAGLSRERLFAVPALGIVAVALVLLYLLTRGPKAPAVRTPHVPPTPNTAAPTGVDAWLTRLIGLLIGRYDIDPERAADLAREAEAHVTESGATPEAEFGPVEDYALGVSRHERNRTLPFHRTRTARILGGVVGVLICGGSFAGWLGAGSVLLAWLVGLPATLGAVWLTITAIRTR